MKLYLCYQNGSSDLSFSNNLPHNTKKALISPNKSQIEVGPKSLQGE